MQISERNKVTQFSPIRRFNMYAAEAIANGKRVFHLNIGQPDVRTPDVFLKSIKEFDEQVLEYAESTGDSRLLTAIAGYFDKFGVELNEDNIIITDGASEGLNMVFSCILNDGDQIMMAEPFYTNYLTFIQMSGGSIAPITTSPETGYAFADPELLEKSYNPNVKAIAVVNPGNPTGRVITDEEAHIIIDFAKKHDLWIISDEDYREFVYDGAKMMTFASYKEAEDRVIIVDSVSKRFSACGARIGYVITKNTELFNGLLKLAQGRLCCPTLEMIGAAALYGVDESYYEDVREEYERRRDLVYDELLKIPGVKCKKPAGAFYIMVTLPVENTEDFLMYLLTEFDDNGDTVMFSPAEGFYMTPGLGRNEIRIAYVLKRKALKRAIELLGMALDKYKAEGHK